MQKKSDDIKRSLLVHIFAILISQDTDKKFYLIFSCYLIMIFDYLFEW